MWNTISHSFSIFPYSHLPYRMLEKHCSGARRSAIRPSFHLIDERLCCAAWEYILDLLSDLDLFICAFFRRRKCDVNPMRRRDIEHISALICFFFYRFHVHVRGARAIIIFSRECSSTVQQFAQRVHSPINSHRISSLLFSAKYCRQRETPDCRLQTFDAISFFSHTHSMRTKKVKWCQFWHLPSIAKLFDKRRHSLHSAQAIECFERARINALWFEKKIVAFQCCVAVCADTLIDTIENAFSASFLQPRPQ